MSPNTPTRQGSDIVRRMPAFVALGKSQAAAYREIARGLLMRPIPIGPRSCGYLASEIEAINAARAAGRSDDEIRTLVHQLVAARTAGAAK